MSNLIDIIDALEKKIVLLLKAKQDLEAVNKDLRNQISVLETGKLQLEDEIADWSEKVHSLKLANSLLGSDQFKRETKLKIDALIREIDHCIMRLSE